MQNISSDSNTQNQTLYALLFLCREVLQQDVDWLATCH